MTSKSKTVCIIGGGGAGLTAAKNMAEQGLSPVIFDKNDQPGGLWSSQESNPTAVWNGLFANISYFTMSFSDHQYPVNTSIIPSLNEVRDYLISYMKKFNLEQYLRLNTHIISAIQSEDSKWKIKTVNTKTKQTDEQVFDFLIVASGLHHKARMPQFENIDSYKGTILHSSNFKLNDELLKSKKVLIVGGCYSASDIASNLVGHAKEIINIFRRPYLVAPRLVKTKSLSNPSHYNIRPIDFCLFTRAAFYSNATTDEERLKSNLNLLSPIYYDQICNDKMNEALKFDLSTDLVPRFSISDFYLAHVKSGNIIAKRTGIKRFEETGVLLDNGEFEECDAVIVCTGFDINVSYFDENTLNKLNYDSNDYKAPYLLYKYTFHPEVKNLAMVLQNDGIYFTGAEMQCKWASLVFSDQKSLPANDIMFESIEKQRKRRCLELKHQYPYPHMIIVKELATELGCEPNFDTLKQSDPDLYRMLWNNLSSSAHFILNDPAKRDYAIEIIKEIDALTNKIYTFDDNSEYNDDYYQQICNVGREFFKENSGRYSVPNYFL